MAPAQVFTLIVLALLILAPLSGQGSPSRVHVLIVDSYHEGFAWSQAQSEGIKSALTSGLGERPLDLSVFHLDDRRFPDKRPDTDAYFDRLYRDQDINLIFSTDNAAWNFMKDRSWRLEKRVALVFAGVNDYVDDGRAGSLFMTGIAENFLSGRADTIKVALALLPATKRVVFTLDTTPTSLAIKHEFEGIKRFFPELVFDWITVEGIDAQLALVAGLGKGDIFMPIGTHRDASGTLLSYEEAMERLSAACPVPSFGFIENRIGHGIVGGKILTGLDHGRSAGELGIAILRGASPSSLQPIMDNPGRFIFDNRQLVRFGLSEAKLPLDAEILHRPVNPLAGIWGYLVVYTLVLLSLILIVILLVASRRRLKTAKTQLMESEKTLESYFENSPDAIFIADDQGRYLRANQSATTLVGYPAPRLLTMKVPDILMPESYEAGGAHFAKVIAEGKAYGELLFRKADGTPFWMSVHAVRLGKDQNLGICLDITKRLSDEESIRRSLSEKETLLRELYHRTKNNMYLIISLLGLREFELASEVDRVIFREMAGRIRTMALVHEKLYRSPDLSHILFDDYLRELVALLAEGLPAEGIRFEFDLEPVELSVDQALPLGLVIYELLVNSLRHAFPGGRGRVGLGLHPLRDGRTGRLELIAWDDGIGLPKGYDPAKGESMGFQVITSIVEHQLGGTISWVGAQGTRCSIVVPTSEAGSLER